MMPRSFLFLLFLFINVVVLGQGQTVKITPGDSAICKGQSIRYNAYLYKGSFQFIGSFDDLRIYNRVLTQEEITYLANN